MPATGLAEVLARLARGERTDFAALLHDVEVHAIVDNTKVTCHCYSLKVDAMGRPRVSELAKAVAEAATDFAIPRSRIAEAAEYLGRTGSPSRLNNLYDQAKALFTDVANSGEGGELLLFVLAERMLRLPQLICKMSLKTNTRMHVHGADGAHAGVDAATGKLALYWGESKIYGDSSAAIRECLSSIGPMLREMGPTATSTRDLQLLDRAIDLNDASLEAALRRYLDPRDPASVELEIRGLCLVGFDCDAYGNPPIGKRQQEVVDAIAAQLPGWKSRIAGRVTAESLSEFAMHMLCVPFPSAEAFREQMRQALGVNRAVS